MPQYLSISDLEKRAKQRLPHIAWEYLDSGTGDDNVVENNVRDFNKITIAPSFMKGELECDTSCSFLGHDYAAPFGVAPVGFPGLIWPKAEEILATSCSQNAIPFTLTTLGTQTPEEIGPLVGSMGWFQLYPPRSSEIRKDLLSRAADSGFHTLVVTADVPTPSRRERPIRAQLSLPPKITPRFVWQGAMNLAWSIQTLRAGLPRLATMSKYANSSEMSELFAFVKANFGGTLSWDYLRELRDEWSGPILLKGILHPDDVEQSIAVGLDGIIVSNHGGRQFDGAPSAIDVLPSIVRQVAGRTKILFDSGVRSGLDVVRALALGADFVLLGRAYMYGLGAVGRRGGHLTTEILLSQLTNNMMQLGCSTVAEIRNLENDIIVRTS